MFLFSANRYIEELKQFRPDILSACEKAIASANFDLDFVRLDESSFSKCPEESIDYAVMEKQKTQLLFQWMLAGVMSVHGLLFGKLMIKTQTAT